MRSAPALALVALAGLAQGVLARGVYNYTNDKWRLVASADNTVRRLDGTFYDGGDEINEAGGVLLYPGEDLENAIEVQGTGSSAPDLACMASDFKLEDTTWSGLGLTALDAPLPDGIIDISSRGTAGMFEPFVSAFGFHGNQIVSDDVEPTTDVYTPSFGDFDDGSTTLDKAGNCNGSTGECDFSSGSVWANTGFEDGALSSPTVGGSVGARSGLIPAAGLAVDQSDGSALAGVDATVVIVCFPTDGQNRRELHSFTLAVRAKAAATPTFTVVAAQDDEVRSGDRLLNQDEVVAKVTLYPGETVPALKVNVSSAAAGMTTDETDYATIECHLSAELDGLFGAEDGGADCDAGVDFDYTAADGSTPAVVSSATCGTFDATDASTKLVTATTGYFVCTVLNVVADSETTLAEGMQVKVPVEILISDAVFSFVAVGSDAAVADEVVDGVTGSNWSDIVEGTLSNNDIVLYPGMDLDLVDVRVEIPADLPEDADFQVTCFAVDDETKEEVTAGSDALLSSYSQGSAASANPTAGQVTLVAPNTEFTFNRKSFEAAYKPQLINLICRAGPAAGPAAAGRGGKLAIALRYDDSAIDFAIGGSETSALTELELLPGQEIGLADLIVGEATADHAPTVACTLWESNAAETAWDEIDEVTGFAPCDFAEFDDSDADNCGADGNVDSSDLDFAFDAMALEEDADSSLTRLLVCRATAGDYIGAGGVLEVVLTTADDVLTFTNNNSSGAYTILDADGEAIADDGLIESLAVFPGQVGNGSDNIVFGVNYDDGTEVGIRIIGGADSDDDEAYVQCRCLPGSVDACEALFEDDTGNPWDGTVQDGSDYATLTSTGVGTEEFVFNTFVAASSLFGSQETVDMDVLCRVVVVADADGFATGAAISAVYGAVGGTFTLTYLVDDTRLVFSPTVAGRVRDTTGALLDNTDVAGAFAVYLEETIPKLTVTFDGSDGGVVGEDLDAHDTSSFDNDIVCVPIGDYYGAARNWWMAAPDDEYTVATTTDISAGTEITELDNTDLNYVKTGQGYDDFKTTGIILDSDATLQIWCRVSSANAASDVRVGYGGLVDILVKPRPDDVGDVITIKAVEGYEVLKPDGTAYSPGDEITAIGLYPGDPLPSFEVQVDASGASFIGTEGGAKTLSIATADLNTVSIGTLEVGDVLELDVGTGCDASGIGPELGLNASGKPSILITKVTLDSDFPDLDIYVPSSSFSSTNLISTSVIEFQVVDPGSGCAIGDVVCISTDSDCDDAADLVFEVESLTEPGEIVAGSLTPVIDEIAYSCDYQSNDAAVGGLVAVDDDGYMRAPGIKSKGAVAALELVSETNPGNFGNGEYRAVGGSGAGLIVTADNTGCGTFDNDLSTGNFCVHDWDEEDYDEWPKAGQNYAVGDKVAITDANGNVAVLLVTGLLTASQTSVSDVYDTYWYFAAGGFQASYEGYGFLYSQTDIAYSITDGIMSSVGNISGASSDPAYNEHQCDYGCLAAARVVLERSANGSDVGKYRCTITGVSVWGTYDNDCSSCPQTEGTLVGTFAEFSVTVLANTPFNREDSAVAITAAADATVMDKDGIYYADGDAIDNGLTLYVGQLLDAATLELTVSDFELTHEGLDMGGETHGRARYRCFPSYPTPGGAWTLNDCNTAEAALVEYAEKLAAYNAGELADEPKAPSPATEKCFSMAAYSDHAHLVTLDDGFVTGGDTTELGSAFGKNWRIFSGVRDQFAAVGLGWQFVEITFDGSDDGCTGGTCSKPIDLSQMFGLGMVTPRLASLGFKIVCDPVAGGNTAEDYDGVTPSYDQVNDPANLSSTILTKQATGYYANTSSAPGGALVASVSYVGQEIEFNVSDDSNEDAGVFSTSGGFDNTVATLPDVVLDDAEPVTDADRFNAIYTNDSPPVYSGLRWAGGGTLDDAFITDTTETGVPSLHASFEYASGRIPITAGCDASDAETLGNWNVDIGTFSSVNNDLRCDCSGLTTSTCIQGRARVDPDDSPDSDVIVPIVLTSLLTNADTLYVGTGLNDPGCVNLTGGTSGATATFDSLTANLLTVTGRTGTFQLGETINCVDGGNVGQGSATVQCLAAAVGISCVADGDNFSSSNDPVFGPNVPAGSYNLSYECVDPLTEVVDNTNTAVGDLDIYGSSVLSLNSNGSFSSTQLDSSLDVIFEGLYLSESGVATISDGDGTGLTVNLTVDTNRNLYAVVDSPGSGYALSETITIDFPADWLVLDSLDVVTSVDFTLDTDNVGCGLVVPALSPGVYVVAAPPSVDVRIVPTALPTVTLAGAAVDSATGEAMKVGVQIQTTTVPVFDGASADLGASNAETDAVPLMVVGADAGLDLTLELGGLVGDDEDLYGPDGTLEFTCLSSHPTLLPDKYPSVVKGETASAALTYAAVTGSVFHLSGGEPTTVVVSCGPTRSLGANLAQAFMTAYFRVHVSPALVLRGTDGFALDALDTSISAEDVCVNDVGATASTPCRTLRAFEGEDVGKVADVVALLASGVNSVVTIACVDSNGALGFGAIADPITGEAVVGGSPLVGDAVGAVTLGVAADGAGADVLPGAERVGTVTCTATGAEDDDTLDTFAAVYDGSAKFQASFDYAIVGRALVAPDVDDRFEQFAEFDVTIDNNAGDDVTLACTVSPATGPVVVESTTSNEVTVSPAEGVDVTANVLVTVTCGPEELEDGSGTVNGDGWSAADTVSFSFTVKPVKLVASVSSSTLYEQFGDTSNHVSISTNALVDGNAPGDDVAVVCAIDSGAGIFTLEAEGGLISSINEDSDTAVAIASVDTDAVGYVDVLAGQVKTVTITCTPDVAVGGLTATAADAVTFTVPVTGIAPRMTGAAGAVIAAPIELLEGDLPSSITVGLTAAPAAGSTVDFECNNTDYFDVAVTSKTIDDVVYDDVAASTSTAQGAALVFAPSTAPVANREIDAPVTVELECKVILSAGGLKNGDSVAIQLTYFPAALSAVGGSGATGLVGAALAPDAEAYDATDGGAVVSVFEGAALTGSLVTVLPNVSLPEETTAVCNSSLPDVVASLSAFTIPAGTAGASVTSLSGVAGSVAVDTIVWFTCTLTTPVLDADASDSSVTWTVLDTTADDGFGFGILVRANYLAETSGDSLSLAEGEGSADTFTLAPGAGFLTSPATTVEVDCSSDNEAVVPSIVGVSVDADGVAVKVLADGVVAGPVVSDTVVTLTCAPVEDAGGLEVTSEVTVAVAVAARTLKAVGGTAAFNAAGVDLEDQFLDAGDSPVAGLVSLSPVAVEGVAVGSGTLAKLVVNFAPDDASVVVACASSDETVLASPADVELTAANSGGSVVFGVPGPVSQRTDVSITCSTGDSADAAAFLSTAFVVTVEPNSIVFYAAGAEVPTTSISIDEIVTPDEDALRVGLAAVPTAPVEISCVAGDSSVVGLYEDVAPTPAPTTTAEPTPAETDADGNPVSSPAPTTPAPTTPAPVDTPVTFVTELDSTTAVAVRLSEEVGNVAEATTVVVTCAPTADAGGLTTADASSVFVTVVPIALQVIGGPAAISSTFGSLEDEVLSGGGPAVAVGTLDRAEPAGNLVRMVVAPGSKVTADLNLTCSSDNSIMPKITDITMKAGATEALFVLPAARLATQNTRVTYTCASVDGVGMSTDETVVFEVLVWARQLALLTGADSVASDDWTALDAAPAPLPDVVLRAFAGVEVANIADIRLIAFPERDVDIVCETSVDEAEASAVVGGAIAPVDGLQPVYPFRHHEVRVSANERAGAVDADVVARVPAAGEPVHVGVEFSSSVAGDVLVTCHVPCPSSGYSAATSVSFTVSVEAVGLVPVVGDQGDVYVAPSPAAPLGTPLSEGTRINGQVIVADDDLPAGTLQIRPTVDVSAATATCVSSDASLVSFSASTADDDTVVTLVNGLAATDLPALYVDASVDEDTEVAVTCTVSTDGTFFDGAVVAFTFLVRPPQIFAADAADVPTTAFALYSGVRYNGGVVNLDGDGRTSVATCTSPSADPVFVGEYVLVGPASFSAPDGSTAVVIVPDGDDAEPLRLPVLTSAGDTIDYSCDGGIATAAFNVTLGDPRGDSSITDADFYVAWDISAGFCQTLSDAQTNALIVWVRETVAGFADVGVEDVYFDGTTVYVKAADEDDEARILAAAEAQGSNVMLLAVAGAWPTASVTYPDLAGVCTPAVSVENFVEGSKGGVTPTPAPGPAPGSAAGSAAAAALVLAGALALLA